MIRSLFGGASKCRTIDKVDIFGDSSGVALYQLDGNANDTGGNYHGTETAITYGGGVYERGAVFNGSSSGILTSSFPQITNNYTVSVWIRKSVAWVTNETIISGGVIGLYGIKYDSGFFAATYLGNYMPKVVNTSYLVDNNWHHIVFTKSSTTGDILYVDGALVNQQSANTANLTVDTLQVNIGKYTNASGYFNGSIDQVRIFNRAITATEVATLYAECAPTSTLDNINPFMDGSLKALYQFNGDATDATGVYNGTATNVTYGTGKFGQCAVFNGTSSKVDVPYSIGHTDVTISMWHKPTLSSRGSLICLDATFNTNSFQIEYETANVYQFCAPSQVEGSLYLFTDTIVRTAVYNHVALVYSASQLKMFCYVNGNLVGTKNIYQAAGSQNPTQGTTTFGLFNGVYANMSIDQARIFNKALTPLEVASLYNETTPLEEPMYKLVDPFKDGSGKALYRLEGNALDESGNYNGTATSVTYGAGQFGRCGVFNGTSSKIDTSYSLSTSAITVSYWAKSTLDIFEVTVHLDTQNFVSFGSISSFVGIYGEKANVFTHYQSTTPVPNNGAFNHFCFTLSGTSLNIYLNGSLISSGTYNNTLTGSLRIGYINDGVAYYYNGSIDKLRIFNKALTASEVSKLYTNENNTI